MISIGFGLLGLSGVGAHPCRRKGKLCHSGEGGLSHVQKRGRRYNHITITSTLLCYLLYTTIGCFTYLSGLSERLYVYSRYVIPPPGFLTWLGSRNSQFSNSWIVNYSVDFPEPRPNTNQQTWEHVGASYVRASSCSRNSWNDYHAIGVVCWVNFRLK